MMRMAELLYRALMLLLPKAFRREFSNDLTAVFRAKLEDANGWLARARVMAGCVVDLLSVAVSERTGRRRGTRGGAGILLRDLPAEVRLAARGLLRTPSYTIAAVLTLGVAIGTVTTFFSVVNGVLLKPLPFRHAERLVIINSPFLTPTNLDDWMREQRTAEAIAAFTIGRGTSALPNGAVILRTMPVGAGFFEMLGTRAVRGRVLLPADHRANAAPVALVSERFWLAQFGSGNAVGQLLTIDRRSYEVVGVLPADFAFQYEDVDVWMPLEQTNIRGVTLVARLPVNRTVEDARIDVLQLASRFATPEVRKRYEGLKLSDANVNSVFEHVVGDARGTIWTLFGAAIIVLLLGAANVATLSIGRALARRDELAVRSALGAGRFRILRQLIVEASVLAAWGAVLGLVITQFLPALIRLAPDFLPRRDDIRVDLNVLLFTLAASTLAVFIFGVVPGIAVSRWNERTSLRAATARGHRAGFAQSGLVVFEIAAGLVLTVGALLMIQTYARLRPTDPGFRVQDRMVASFALPTDAYGDDARAQGFADALLDGIGGLPGAPTAALATDLPLTGSSMMIPLRSPAAGTGDPPLMHFRAVSPNYFAVMEMPVKLGRGLLESDRGGGPSAAVINETAAQRLWPDASPLGRVAQLEINGRLTDLQVVGVVEDAWIFQGPDTKPEIFASFWQMPFSRFSVVVAHAPAQPFRLKELRDVVNALDASVPVRDLVTMRERIAWTVTIPRFQATVLSLLTAIALILAATGCVGVLSQIIGRRTREFAVRMAVGARAASVVGLILRRALLLAFLGTVLGIGCAMAATRVLESYLYGVSRTDPLTFGAAALGLTLIVIAAALFPARRVARLSPIATLREGK